MPESQGVLLLSSLESQFRFTTIQGVRVCGYVRACARVRIGCMTRIRKREEERGTRENACASESVMRNGETIGEQEGERDIEM